MMDSGDAAALTRLGKGSMAMTENQPAMSEERLEELRKCRDEVHRNPPPAALSHVWRVLVADAVDEIDRLRAENERLLLENLTLKMQPVFDEYRP